MSSFVAEQLDTSLQFFQSLRNSQGIYYDKFCYCGTSPLSTSATGFGLVALTISAERGLLSRDDACSMARNTMQSVKGTDAFSLTRSANGFMAHWPDEEGHSAGEISTIDTAILVLGAMFADNYFEDPALHTLVVEVATSVSWTDVLHDERGHPQMSLKCFRDGTPDASKTRPFNEYYLLSICGALVETKFLHAPGDAHRYFLAHFATPPGAEYCRSNYWGYELLTDIEGRFLPSFIVQFCFYLSGHFNKSEEYCNFADAAASADAKFWCNALPDQNRGGCGAGAYPSNFRTNPKDPFGYKATAIDENEELVYSAPIVAGFLPFRPTGAELLKAWHTADDACKYRLPSGDSVLWRASVKLPKWRAQSIEAVDFATAFLGYAAHVLGRGFFERYAPDL